MTTETLTLTDFLLARIAEDVAVARSLPSDDSPDAYACDAGRDDHVAVPRERWLAECEAKRVIVETFHAARIAPWLSTAGC